MAIKTIRTNCRYCGASIWAQEDCKEPTCVPCDELETAMLDESFAIEDTFGAVAHTDINLMDTEAA